MATWSNEITKTFEYIFLKQASTASAVSSTVSKESEEEVGLATPTTTPKLGRRGRGGSFSSPGRRRGAGQAHYHTQAGQEGAGWLL